MSSKALRVLLIAIASIGTVGLVSAGILRAQAVPATTTADLSPPSMATATTSLTAESGTFRQERLDTLAQSFGMTSAQLRTELNSGKPLYQIAVAHGQTYDTLLQKKENDYKATLDDMVKVGYLTQDQANTFLQQFKDNEKNLGPLGPLEGHGHHGGMGFMMHRDVSGTSASGPST